MRDEIGAWVSVELTDGTLIEGWLYGVNPTGIYVSLDPSGTHIRYVPTGNSRSISYGNRATRASFSRDRDVEAAEEAERFNDELSEAVIESFSKIDYNRVRRIAVSHATE